MEIAKYRGSGRITGGLVVIVLILYCGSSFSQDRSYSGEIKPTDNPTNLGTVLRDENRIVASTCSHLHREPLSYLLLLPGPILFVIVAFTKRAAQRGLEVMVLLGLIILPCASGYFPIESIREGIEAFEGRRYETALEKFELSLEVCGCNPSLVYNIALCQYELGLKGAALYNLRRCIRQDPWDWEARAMLKNMETGLELAAQVPPGINLHPNCPFISALVLFNLSAAVLGLVYRLKKGGLFILFILLAFSTLISIGTLIYSIVEQERGIGVVIHEYGYLKKIPLDEADNWIELKEGTSLIMRGKAQEYILVRTGLGLEGWIKHDELQF